jgi:hypothetical protein
MEAQEGLAAFMKRMSALDAKFEERHGSRIAELLDVCKVKQGRYLDFHHGPGSWATRYSHDFVEAASEIYRTIIRLKPNAMWEMSELFRAYGIRSCRGSVMDPNKVEYLYETYIKWRLNDNVN